MKHGIQKKRGTHPAVVVVVFVLGLSLGALGMFGYMSTGGSGQVPGGSDDVVKVETPFGHLQYPADYENAIIAEGREVGSAYVVDFSAEYKGEVIPLYSIHFGDELGQIVGEVSGQDEGGVIVSVEAHEYEFDGTWSQSEIDEVCAMQESVNEVLDSLLMKND